MKEMNVDFLRAALERGDYNPPSDLQGNVVLEPRPSRGSQANR
jgi:hypothetical protein